MNITLDFRRFSLELHGLHRLLVATPGGVPFFAIEVGTEVVEDAFPDLPMPRPWFYKGVHGGHETVAWIARGYIATISSSRREAMDAFDAKVAALEAEVATSVA
jgi:hypothetical protein